MPSQKSSCVAFIRVLEAAEEVLKTVHPLTTPMVTLRDLDVLHVTPCGSRVMVASGLQATGSWWVMVAGGLQAEGSWWRVVFKQRGHGGGWFSSRERLGPELIALRCGSKRSILLE